MPDAEAGFAAIRPFLRRRLTALFGHRVADDPSPFTAHVYRHPGVAEFAQALDFLKRHFQFVTLDTVIGHFADGRPLPDYPLFLSFDDGFSDMAETVAPMLRAAGVPATFFLTARAVDNRDLFYGLRRSYLIEQARAMRGDASQALAASLQAVSVHTPEGRAVGRPRGRASRDRLAGGAGGAPAVHEPGAMPRAARHGFHAGRAWRGASPARRAGRGCARVRAGGKRRFPAHGFRAGSRRVCVSAFASGRG